MIIDTYTKVLLTTAVVFLGVIALDYKPAFMEGATNTNTEMLQSIRITSDWKETFPYLHLKDGKKRICMWKSFGEDFDFEIQMSDGKSDRKSTWKGITWALRVPCSVPPSS